MVRIEQAHDHGVDGDGFARAGGAGDEDVGHGGEVGGDDAAVDVFAHGEGEARFGLGEGFAFEHVAEVDGFAFVVGDLDADGAFAGHALDEDALGAHGEAEVVGEAGDAGVFDAGFGLELVGGDHGAGVDVLDLAADVELGALFDEYAGFVAEIVFADNLGTGAGIEQGAGRELEAADVFGSDGNGAFVGIGAFVNGNAVGRGTLSNRSGNRRGGRRGAHFDNAAGRWLGRSGDGGRSGWNGWCGLRRDRHGGDLRSGVGDGALPDAGAAWRNRFSSPATWTCRRGPRFSTPATWTCRWRPRFSTCFGSALEGGNLIDRIGLGRAFLHTEECGEAARTRGWHVGGRRGSVANSAGEQALRGAGLSLLGKALFKFALALGALFAPVAIAIVPCNEGEPAIFDLRFELPEVDVGGKINADGGEGRGHQPCALDVEVDDERAGDYAAHDAFDRDGVEPVPMPGEEAEEPLAGKGWPARCPSSAGSPIRRSGNASSSSRGRRSRAERGKR